MQRIHRISCFVRAVILFSVAAIPSGTSAGQSASERPAQQAQTQTTAPESPSLPPQWSDAVHTLASKIVAAAQPAKTVFPPIKNLSGIDAVSASLIQNAIVAELKDKNLQVVTGQTVSPPGDATVVQVTLSQSATGYLWVAQVIHGDSEQVEMVVPAKVSALAVTGRLAIVLQSKKIWEQPAAILDFATAAGSDGSRLLLILEADRVRLERIAGNSSEQLSEYGISPVENSRDVRGWLIIESSNQFRAYVAGNICNGVWDAALAVQCQENEKHEWPIQDGWQARYDPARNFFKETMKAGGSDANETPFFSAASFAGKGSVQRIFAELDGTAELFNGPAAPAAKVGDWGSNIASIAIPCSSNWYVLASGTGDWTQTDQIQTYEVDGNQAIAAGRPVSFGGPVLALWKSEDGKSARVVSRNLKTGMYEASIVSAACSD